MNKNIPISQLQSVLTHKYGSEWLQFEPETIMMDLENPDYLVMEKIFVLQALNRNLNGTLALPEFVTWTSSVCNNEYAEFEVMEMPNILELAWMITEVKKVSVLSKQEFTPSEEFIGTVAYLLNEDGLSAPISPFEFIPEVMFTSGQTESDISLKEEGIQAYLTFMEEQHARINY